MLKTPACIKSLQHEKIIFTTAGNYSSFFLSKTGKIFACGRNIKGELGMLNQTQLNEPLQIEFPGDERFMYVVCREYSVMAISQGSKHVWVWGENACHKLGIESKDADERIKSQIRRSGKKSLTSAYDPTIDNVPNKKSRLTRLRILPAGAGNPRQKEHAGPVRLGRPGRRAQCADRFGGATVDSRQQGVHGAVAARPGLGRQNG